MKKLFTLIAFIGLGFAANAQRHCDMAVTMVQPTAAQNITSGVPFATNIVITNNGPDAFKPTDSMLYAYFANGRFLHFGSAGGNDSIFLYGTTKTLNVGDTVQINANFNFGGWHTSADFGVIYCFEVAPYNNTADSMRDPNNTNDGACDSLVFLDVPKIATSNGTISLYPNPAQSQVNIGINLIQAANVSVKIFDMVGREVYTNNAGKLSTGINTVNVNTSNFVNGVYIYQVMVGDETRTGKFNVAK